jgi:hypothetical protein
MLTAVSVLWARAPHAVPAAAAVVYLRVERTRTLVVGNDTVGFGFHAAAPRSHVAVLNLVGLLDRIFVQARRHATILAGHQLLDDLTGLQAAARGMPTRGISALVPTWGRDERERGVAGYVDTSTCADGGTRTLDEACTTHRIAVGGLPEGLDAHDTLRQRHQTAMTRRDQHAADRVLAAALGHSLAIALVAADACGKYRWDEPLDLGTLIFREAWDHLPTLTPPTSPSPSSSFPSFPSFPSVPSQDVPPPARPPS